MNALCEFKFQFSEQKPHAHKNINFCPTSKGGKIQRHYRTVPKRAQLRISGVCVCVCELNQDKGAKTMKAEATPFGLTLMLLFYVFPIFHVCLGALFLTTAHRFSPTVFIFKQFISIEM